MRAPTHFLGALRVTSQHPTLVHPFTTTRALSTLVLRSRPNAFNPSAPRLLVASTFNHAPTRPFSLMGMFGRKPVQSPSPQVVAHITRLEAEANVQPHDVPKQVALFQALNETKLKSSYELIITRWERMCEFDSTSPLLHSQEAFQLYLKALIHTGQQASINPAVRRRDSLLQAVVAASSTAPTVTNPEPAQVSPENASDSAASVSDPVTTNEAQVSSAPKAELTPSQQVAQAVLASEAAAVAGAPAASPASPANAFPSLGDGTNKGPIQVSIVESKGAWVPRLVRFVALVLVSSFFFLVILSVMFENTGFMKAGPRQSQFEPTEGKTVMFSDVHGVDEAKEELKDVVLFLKDPTAFASLGGKLPKGVLLTGPPGTGKTLLARAVAGEAGVPFFFSSGSDFEEMFVGLGAKRVRELFAAARKKQPAIIFIDELDAVGGKRSGRDQQYMKQTLNQLLVEMDGFQQSEGVIVIAATNFPESLDQALVRPGRFDRHVAVPLPDIRGRVQILQHHMKGITVDSEVDPKTIARGTPGFSGADLQNMVNQAAIQASKERAKVVGLKHFDWARDRILMGAERKSQFIAHKEKLATAYHEGGHALVALYTEGAMPLHKVTCVPRGHALGYTSQLPEDDRTSVSYKQYLAEIDVSMGGRVAEELIYGTENVTSGASSDIRSATSTATSMVRRWGFSKLGPIYYGDKNDNLSPRRQEEIEDEITKLVRDGEGRVHKLLTSKIDELHKLANALVEHETLDQEEVRKVIKGEQIRNITEVLDEEISNIKSEQAGSEAETGTS